MRKTIPAIFLGCILCSGAWAQEGVFAVREAQNPEGKILTMEDAILSYELSPSIPNRKAVLEFFSPSSVRAQSKDGSLYLDEHCIAKSEGEGIVYGESVSRNEFGISGGIFWSPDSTRIAFYRKDESRVTKFPLLNIKSRTGKLSEIRYPMAGMDSELISLGIYSLKDSSTVYAAVDDFSSERYLTNISWTPDSRHILIQVLNREQNQMHLNEYSAIDGSFERNILSESDSRYVEPLDPIHFLAGSPSQFIYRTDCRDGYRNLYLCSLDGSVERLTYTDADVEYVGNDGHYVYYSSAEVSPIENHLFRVGLYRARKTGLLSRYGKVERLTQDEGWHKIYMAPDCSHYYDVYSSLDNPGTLEKVDCKSLAHEVLGQAPDPTKDYAWCEIDMGKVKSADGQYDNYYRLVKPLNFDPSKKYPVIVYVYGGPHSQMIKNSWLGELRRWQMYMAQRGYLVYCQDNRGTSNRGAEFEKCIHRHCGQAEMADQMEGIKMLKSLSYVDSTRIGIHGWSYGGFMTISLMTSFPGTFKVGVAGGPVIDWKWYEVMYGERYMDTPEQNPEGFEQTSLIPKAKDLSDRLLICQGMLDNTVVPEHSLSFVQQCVEDGVQLDYFPYPMSEHNVVGPWRVHLMDKVSEYFFEKL